MKTKMKLVVLPLLFVSPLALADVIVASPAPASPLPVHVPTSEVAAHKRHPQNINTNRPDSSDHNKNLEPSDEKGGNTPGGEVTR